MPSDIPTGKYDPDPGVNEAPYRSLEAKGPPTPPEPKVGEEAVETATGAAWAAMCERTSGTTRHVDEAVEWKQAVETIIEDALPALHASWREEHLARLQEERDLAVEVETELATELAKARTEANTAEAQLERCREALKDAIPRMAGPLGRAHLRARTVHHDDDQDADLQRVVDGMGLLRAALDPKHSEEEETAR